MEDMREKINTTLFKMVSFIDITRLSVDDIELNKETVNWISKIKPIFEQSSSMYEQKKFELEEQLQNKIVNLNNQIDSTFSKQVLFYPNENVVYNIISNFI